MARLKSRQAVHQPPAPCRLLLNPQKNANEYDPAQLLKHAIPNSNNAKNSVTLMKHAKPDSRNRTQQLGLEDELAFFVLLAGLVRLVVFPAYSLLALSTLYVAYNVASRGHVALVWI